MKTMFVAASAVALALAAPAFAAGNKTGYTSTSTTGNSGKLNTNSSTSSYTTTTGPSGQIKQGNTTCTTCTTTGPGKSK